MTSQQSTTPAADQSPDAVLSDTYRIAQNSDGDFRWFEPHCVISEDYKNVQIAPQEITDIATRMMAEDAAGQISDDTASAMRQAIDKFTDDFNKSVIS